MKEELGASLTAEAVEAFKALLDHTHNVLSKANNVEALTADDLSVVQDDWILIKKNKNFGANAIVKYVQTSFYYATLILNCGFIFQLGFSTLTPALRPCSPSSPRLP